MSKDYCVDAIIVGLIFKKFKTYFTNKVLDNKFVIAVFKLEFCFKP